MTVVEARGGSGRLSSHGKRMVARVTYAKGASFLGAAVLLRRQHGYEAVVLHVLCQGVEIVLKGILLFRNYDKYQPKLRQMGHNLEKLAMTAVREFRTRPLAAGMLAELNVLSGLYSKHLLRYGTFYDVLVDPASIPTAQVSKKILAVIRLANRHIPEKKGAT